MNTLLIQKYSDARLSNALTADNLREDLGKTLRGLQQNLWAINEELSSPKTSDKDRKRLEKALVAHKIFISAIKNCRNNLGNRQNVTL